MFIPSISILLGGALLTAVLAAIDWYVWGVNLGSNPRLRQYAWLPTGVELVDLGISRLLAAHQAVLPTASFESAQAKGVSIATDPDDGSSALPDDCQCAARGYLVGSARLPVANPKIGARAWRCAAATD
jgi:hypothetical protein